MPSTALFWGALVSTLGWALWLRDPAAATRTLRAATAVLLGVLVVGHLATFGVDGVTPAAWWVNGSLFGIAIVLAAMAIRTPVLRNSDDLVRASAVE